VERVNLTLKTGTSNIIIDQKLLSVTLPALGEIVKQITYNYNMRTHSSTNYAPYELYYGLKVINNPLASNINLVNGVPGKKLTEFERTEMNTKSLQAQEARAKRNYSLRWKKYKAAIKETLLVEGQLVLVKPLIQPSHLDKKTTLFHACARVHRILAGTDFCILEWVTDGPTASDKPGTLSKNWLVTALTKVVDGTDEEEIVDNMRNYSGWSRNFEINNILGKLSDTKSGAIYYFIQWEGFSIEESSWVRRENVMDIPTIEKYILEYNIPFKKLQYNSNLHATFTEELSFSSGSNIVEQKKKTNTLFKKVLHKTASSSTTYSNYSNHQNQSSSNFGSSSSSIKLSYGTPKPVPPVMQNPATTNTNNSNWIFTAYNALSNVGYWQIEPYIYNQKMSLWNEFVAVEGGTPALELFISKYFESLNWTKFGYLHFFVESTHPSQYLAAQNMEYFRKFFFTRYTTHNIFIFPTYSLLKTVTAEVVIKDYINKTANHRKPQMFGIQYHNGNHFFLILYKPSLEKFIVVDSLKNLEKSAYVNSVLYLNYLIGLVDNIVNLPFDSNDHKLEAIPTNKLNQTFTFNKNLSIDKKAKICSHISIWKQFWTQPNYLDCGIYAWLFLYSM
jgi:hypothetical protein